MSRSDDRQIATGACVAVVEGDEAWRRTLAAILGGAGYQVLDVAEAARIRWDAMHPSPRLLVQDVAPPKTFHEALQGVRVARERTNGCCPIAVTGPQYATQLSILARASRAVGWVERSDNPSVVLRAVQKLMAQGATRPSVSEWEGASRAARVAQRSWAIVKLLLIDDSEIALELMQEQLLRAGFDVRIALALSEMHSILRGWSPNVILIDVNMPEIRGDQLCARLKAQVGSDVVVVLCSNMPAGELSAVAEAAGADGFVSKSEGLAHFADNVAAWCRRLSDPIVSIQ